MRRSFIRHFELNLQSLGPGEHRRAHLFSWHCQVSGPVDSESGMIINLVVLDELISGLKNKYHGMVLEWHHSFKEWPTLFLELAKNIHHDLASSLPQGLSLVGFEAIEVRGGEAYEWNESMGWLIKTRHFLERFDGAGEVWECHLSWRPSSLWLSYSSEGVLLLKDVLPQFWQPEDGRGLLKTLSPSGLEVVTAVFKNKQTQQEFLITR